MDINKVLNNFTTQDIILVFLILIVVYLMFRGCDCNKQSETFKENRRDHSKEHSREHSKEHFSSNNLDPNILAAIQTSINSQYNLDIEAMRNLGAISKSLLTGTNYHSLNPGVPGDLQIPADNTILLGNLSVGGNINFTPQQLSSLKQALVSTL